MTLSPTALEAAAKAVRQSRNKSITPTDEGTEYDTALATAAVTAYLAQAGKEGWVMAPVDPNYDMGEAGMGKFASFHDEHPAACVDEIYRAMIANRPLAAAQNGGE